MRVFHPFSGILRLSVLVFLTGVLAAAPIDDYARQKSKLDAELTAAEYLLGQWCVEQKMYDQAHAHFLAALAITPDHAKTVGALRKLPGAATPDNALQCEVILPNQDRIKARLLSERILLRTSSGVLIIPVCDTEVINFGSDGKPDFVVAENFVGHGYLVPRDFAAKSMIGDFTIKGAATTSIRVFRPCDGCEGKGLTECATCEGKGEVSKELECPDCKGAGGEECTRARTARLTVARAEVPATSVLSSVVFLAAPTAPGARTAQGGVPTAAKRGFRTCKRCLGKKIISKRVPCPDCEGKKEVPCTKCDKSGVKALSQEGRKALGVTDANSDNNGPDGKEVATDPVIP